MYLTKFFYMFDDIKDIIGYQVFACIKLTNNFLINRSLNCLLSMSIDVCPNDEISAPNRPR